MQGKITKRTVDALKAGILADTEVKGFVVRRLDSGAATFGYRYRDKSSGTQRWLALGIYSDAFTPEQARTIAKKRAGEVADSRDPVGELEESRTAAKLTKAAETNTVNVLLDKFVARYVIKQAKLRSKDQIESTFDRLVRPRIGHLSIYDVRKSHINKMLNEIGDQNGLVMADLALAHVRKAFNWYAAKGEDDDFKSPIVLGMAHTKPAQRKRKRTLTDDEIRDVWAALDQFTAPACYPAYVRNLLLTMTRRTESSKLHSMELEGELWTIPGERYKNKLDHVIPLSAMALENLKTTPSPEARQNAFFLFSTTGGKKAFSGFSKAKAELDRIIAKIRKEAGRPPMQGKKLGWTLHDLRRTARTLMSRAGVPEDHAERAMGHIIAGVRGTYDRYQYLDEKRRAFEALAQQVGMILNPPARNVVKLERATA